MKKEIIATADFLRKPYVRPQIRVVEMKEADIICTSGGTEEYGEGDTSDWFNN